MAYFLHSIIMGGAYRNREAIPNRLLESDMRFFIFTYSILCLVNSAFPQVKSERVALSWVLWQYTEAQIKNMDDPNRVVAAHFFNNSPLANESLLINTFKLSAENIVHVDYNAALRLTRGRPSFEASINHSFSLLEASETASFFLMLNSHGFPGFCARQDNSKLLFSDLMDTIFDAVDMHVQDNDMQPHIVLIIDACYSGSLLSDLKIRTLDSEGSFSNGIDSYKYKISLFLSAGNDVLSWFDLHRPKIMAVADAEPCDEACRVNFSLDDEKNNHRLWTSFDPSFSLSRVLELLHRGSAREKLYAISELSDRKIELQRLSEYISFVTEQLEHPTLRDAAQEIIWKSRLYLEIKEYGPLLDLAFNEDELSDLIRFSIDYIGNDTSDLIFFFLTNEDYSEKFKSDISSFFSSSSIDQEKRKTLYMRFLKSDHLDLSFDNQLVAGAFIMTHHPISKLDLATIRELESIDEDLLKHENIHPDMLSFIEAKLAMIRARAGKISNTH